jgi:hypothetical protein
MANADQESGTQLKRARDSAKTQGDKLAHAVSGYTPEEEDEDRSRRIREAAYRRAEQRGFAPGGELDDWLAAERELNEPRGDGSVG